MGRGRAAILIGVLALIRVVGLAVALHTPAASRPGHVLVADVDRLREVAHAGPSLTPAHSEYPPLAVALAKTTANHGRFRTVVFRVALVMLAADLLAAAALAWGFGAETAAAYLLLGLPLLPFIYFRIDLLAVLIVAKAWALIRRRHETVGGVALAVAAFVKVWPVVLLPVLYVRGKRRAAVAATVAGALGAIAWLAAAGLRGPIDVVTFRHARGLHAESVPGSLWRLVDHGRIVFEAGAQRTPPVPAAVRLGLLALLVGAVTWVVRRAMRTQRNGVEEYAALAAVAAVIVCSALFSPQYVAWLLPFAAIAAVHDPRRRPVEFVTLLVAGLSTVVVIEFGALTAGSRTAEALLLARNATLVALFVIAARRMAPAPRQ
jgi:hypothetical protein